MPGDAGPLSPFVPGGTGPLSPFVHGGFGPLFAVHGVVVVVCPCHAVCGWWWWCTLISFHVAWCVALITVMVVLSSLEGEGGGLFMSADAPSIIVPHWHPALFPCAVVVCPHSHVSSLLSCVPCHCCVSLPCHCPLLSSSLFHDVVVAMPSL